MSPQTQRFLKYQNSSVSFRLSDAGEQILEKNRVSIICVPCTVPVIMNSTVWWPEHHVLSFFILIWSCVTYRHFCTLQLHFIKFGEVWVFVKCLIFSYLKIRRNRFLVSILTQNNGFSEQDYWHSVKTAIFVKNYFRSQEYQCHELNYSVG